MQSPSSKMPKVNTPPPPALPPLFLPLPLHLQMHRIPMPFHIIAPKHLVAVGTRNLDLGGLVLVGHGLRAIRVVDDVVATEVLLFGVAFAAYLAGFCAFVVILVFAVLGRDVSLSFSGFNVGNGEQLWDDAEGGGDTYFRSHNRGKSRLQTWPLELVMVQMNGLPVVVVVVLEGWPASS